MGAAEKPWLSFYPEEVPASLEYPEIPLYQFMIDSAEAYPEHEALYFLGKRINYTELLKLSYRFANLLKSIGVKKGDRVAIMLPNSPQSVFCYYGALMTGAVVVQTNPLYVERELEFQLNDAGAKVLVALDLVYPRVKKVKSKTSLEHIFVTSIKDFLPFPKNFLYPLVQKRQGMPLPQIERKDGFDLLMDRMKAVADVPVAETINPREDLALLQYTGGTTGTPKGVMLTHFNLVVNCVQCEAWIYKSKRGEEKLLAALPFFHVYGMSACMNLGMLTGSTLLLSPKFEPSDVLKLIHKERPTLFPGAPTMYIALINHPDLKKYDLSSIKACLSGASALPLEVQNRFEELSGGRLVEGYGLTETSPVTHANPIYDRRILGSIGLPWPDTDAKVVNSETGEEMSTGEIGEIAIKGPQVMQGYWNLPEETRESFMDGWFLTGDMGYVDEEGYFYIVDRKKDMIIAGGFNIYPREIEEVLFQHPAIKEACVAGVTDPYRGETVKAYIVLKEGIQVSEEELDKFAREKLAAYKVPRLYEFRNELPKTLIGKVLRRHLIEEEEAKMAQSS